MGHVRLGRLPQTRDWRRVVDLLSDEAADVDELSRATMAAARRLFGSPKEGLAGSLASDPGLVQAFYVLAQTVFAAREDDFLGALSERGIGIPPRDTPSAVALVAAISASARETARHHPDATPFSEIAALALREVLSGAIVSQARTLFGSTTADVQEACRRYASRQKFGKLSRQFFASFVYRTLGFFLSKEINQHVGPGARFERLSQVDSFERELRGWAFERARIVESFAGGWTSKEDFEVGITPEGVRRFMGVAIRKLSEEFQVSDAREASA